MPFVCRRCRGVATLALGNKCLPLSLPRKLCQTCHISFPIKFINRIANHKHLISITVNLHIEDSDFPLAGHYLWPYMRMRLDVLSYELFVGN